MQVNGAKDFIERVFWTLAEFAVALPLANWLTGDPLSWWTPLIVGAVASLKVLVAQHVGTRGSGDAIPGGVIQGPTA